MTIFLNILYILVSVLFFSGRLYEIMFFMDTRTGFLSQGRVVSGPFMLALLALIAVCCGVILFSGDSKQDKRQLSVGIFGILAAVLLVFSAVLSIQNIFKVGGFLGSDIMIIIGAAGLLIYAFKGIKGEKYEKIPFVMTILLPIGLCIDVALFSVSTISNTVFLMHALSYILTFVFLLLMFKYVYFHSKFTTGALYVVSLLNFTVSAAGGLASVVGNAALGTMVLMTRLRDTGVAMLGFYALYIAFNILPEKAAATATATTKSAWKSSVENKRTGAEEEDYKEDSIYSLGSYSPTQQEGYASSYSADNFTEDVGRISGRVISGLFDAERAQDLPQYNDDDSTGVFNYTANNYERAKYDEYKPDISSLFADEEKPAAVEVTTSQKEKTVELPYRIPATDTTVDIPVIIKTPRRDEEESDGADRARVWNKKTVYTPDKNATGKARSGKKVVYKARK